MNKSTVVIVGGFRLPDGNASAIRCGGNTNLFRRLGYRVVVVGKVDARYAEKGKKWYSFFGVDCLDLETCIKDFTRDIDYVRTLAEKYDVQSIKAVIAYNYPGKALNRLRKWCRKNSIYPIADTTEWYAFEGKNVISAVIRKLSTEYRMRIVNRRIGNIICSTNYIRDYYGQKYNTIIIPMICEDEISNRKTSFPVNHPRKFIYAGSPGLNFSKDDIETIVRTFLSIDQKYELLFYGFTIDDFLKNYPQYEQKLRAKKEIHFMGRVSKRIINEALSSSDFYVLYRPNTKVNKVGFSTKSMEAISNCVPLIANDVNGDFNLYFQQNQALISPVDDYDSFANNVVSAINMSDEDVIKMKNNCAQYNPFAMEQYVESMNTFMERLK